LFGLEAVIHFKGVAAEPLIAKGLLNPKRSSVSPSYFQHSDFGEILSQPQRRFIRAVRNYADSASIDKLAQMLRVANE
jgi:hypothetical protein